MSPRPRFSTAAVLVEDSAACFLPSVRNIKGEQLSVAVPLPLPIHTSSRSALPSSQSGGCRSELSQGHRFENLTGRWQVPSTPFSMEVDDECATYPHKQQQLQWAPSDLHMRPSRAMCEDLLCSNCGRCTRRSKLDGSRGGKSAQLCRSPLQDQMPPVTEPWPGLPAVPWSTVPASTPEPQTLTGQVTLVTVPCRVP